MIETGQTKVSSSVTSVTESIKTMKDSVEKQIENFETGMNLIAANIEKSGIEGKAVLEVIGSYIKDNSESFKDFDANSKKTLETLVENIAKSSIANADGLTTIAESIKGSNGELNFILKNLTENVKISGKGGIE